MDLRETLDELQTLAKKLNIAKVFLCGGIPRDTILEDSQNIEDVDLTNGEASISKLAEEFGKVIVQRGGDYRTLSDGHAQIQLEGIKLDFSSHYLVPGIKNMLEKVGARPTEMMMECFSRDFTINSMIEEIDFTKVLDPTGLGINDINKELIRTCLPAKITLGVDNKRVVRVIYLAAKLGFSVDKEIIEWVKANPSSIANVKPKYLSQKLQKACDYDVAKTAELLTMMNLWDHVPILPDLMPYASNGLVGANG